MSWLRSPRLLLAVSIVLVVAACGGDGESAEGLDPVMAESCSELADMNVQALQDVLTAMGTLSAEEIDTDPPAELASALEVHFEFLSTAGISAANEFCGSLGELEQLLCDRKSTLQTDSTEADEYIENNTPPC